MGYNTKFAGELSFDRPVPDDLRRYINAFSAVRHVRRDVNAIRSIFPDWKEYSWKGDLGSEGEYFIGPRMDVERPYIDSQRTFERWMDEIHRKNAIINDNRPPAGVPGLWCEWIINDRGNLAWSGGQKFYDYEEWLVYLIDRFFYPEGLTLNGKLLYSGEREDDMGYIIVNDNAVRKVSAWDFVSFNEAEFIGAIEREIQ